MHVLSFLALLSSSALAGPSALSKPGTNIATVRNKCPFPVYLWSTPGGQRQVANAHMVTLASYRTKSGASNVYSETMHQSPDGSGISIKIALSKDLPSVMSSQIEQLEYAINTQMNTVFYDLSEINGGPFAAKGHFVELSADPNCPVVHSSTAYHRLDDVATKACKLPSNLILTLCS